VEIHAANGYLVDQFTQDVCNNRQDRWGGSIENRSRFGLEVAKSVAAAVGPDRTGIRLSPWSAFQNMGMADRKMPQFSHLVKGLRDLHLAYLHLVEPRVSGAWDIEATDKNDPFIQMWGKTSPVFLAGGFKPDSARRAVDEDFPDQDVAVVFGRRFISTPDLVFRIQRGIDLAKYNRETFYLGRSQEGYTDYPYSAEWLEEMKQ
jgi:NADPH2 dehydrogenase